MLRPREALTSARSFRADLDRGDVPMMSKTDLLEQRSTRCVLFALGKIGALVLLVVLAACKKEEKAATPDIRPVRTVIVEPSEGGETVSLTGEIQARYQADIGFRVKIG